jgi:hypothetical protein
MVCSICRQPGHNRQTCYRHPNVLPTGESPQVTLAPLDARDVIISELRSEVSALKDQCAILLQDIHRKRERNRAPKANFEKIQDILFTNQESIPEGVYLGLMNALVGK